MALAHTQPAVLVVGIVTQTVAAVAHSPVWTAVSVILTIGAGVTIGAEYFHSSRLCPRCASHIPLDGHAAAEKHAIWLRVHHWCTSPVVLLAWRQENTSMNRAVGCCIGMHSPATFETLHTGPDQDHLPHTGYVRATGGTPHAVSRASSVFTAWVWFQGCMRARAVCRSVVSRG